MGTPAVKIKSGNAISRGFHQTPRTERTPTATVSRNHSGISGSERSRLVQYLKRGTSPRALINPAVQAEDPHQSFAIDAPVPTDMSQTVVVFRPLFFQHRLSASVSSLLLQISEHRVSPVMPHHCCGVETDLPPALLQ